MKLYKRLYEITFKDSNNNETVRQFSVIVPESYYIDRDSIRFIESETFEEDKLFSVFDTSLNEYNGKILVTDTDITIYTNDTEDYTDIINHKDTLDILE